MNREPVLQHPLVQRLIDARSVTDALFAVVKPEYLYERPIRERHRIVFYIGHLEAFDRNLFDERLTALPAFAPELDTLFAFGIDPVDGGFPTDQPSDWPTIDVVSGYGNEAREQIDGKLKSFEFGHGDMSTGSPAQLLNVAIEHRLMHAETLAYMLHQLPLEMKAAPARSMQGTQQLRNVESSPMLRVPAGETVLGMPKVEGRFGWDNEFGEQRVHVDMFEIDRYMVTNAQYREFIDAGGYRERALWSDKDWAWKEAERISHPVTWSQNADGEWMLRTMFEDVALPPDWPVYVSHAEASAYARWAGKTLPTEAQWQRAAHGAPPSALGNFDFRNWDPQAVDASPDNVSAFGVEGQYGNGWEWTSSLFEPLPGFDAFPFYPGYSANFFDGQHYVLKGGSARTARCMVRPTFRNWFQPRYQHVYAGFRCVRN
ncbi:SUMF1/EgtB/PvdO family nonheme iron enzyme [Paraburkholderia diazotrophica]|uniref:Ergothioneine biosynthesis protein EgtB n=1 Tax=Paraburkholderia diazotrophica TaxID=667676 RepID=A0A1H6SLC2_9BURK|nr:SUMF1/EgtB/PvdO family nonheme iron enzyme [Paraburkholderia diazotrophica]SEI68728.1 ergothioneine biosynthesis protein EgtB [Paraburkholderia diazotrophica]